MNTGVKIFAALLLLGWSTQTLQAQKPAAGGDAKSATPASVPAAEEEYKIGPQDVLRVDVWKEAELTRTVPVRPDGKISLPLLNDVQASGLTPSQLAKVLTDGLKKF